MVSVCRYHHFSLSYYIFRIFRGRGVSDFFYCSSCVIGMSKGPDHVPGPFCYEQLVLGIFFFFGPGMSKMHRGQFGNMNKLFVQF